MASRRAIIIVAVIAVLAIAVLAVVVASSDSDDSPDTPAVSPDQPTTPSTPAETDDTPIEDKAAVEIGWRAELSPTLYEKDLDYTVYPDNGNQFVILHFCVKNDSYTDGIDIGYFGDLSWRVTYNNVEYTSEGRTILADGYNDVKINVGGQESSVVVFQVPSALTADDLDFTVYHGKSITMEYNSALVLYTYSISTY